MPGTGTSCYGCRSVLQLILQHGFWTPPVLGLLHLCITRISSARSLTAHTYLPHLPAHASAFLALLQDMLCSWTQLSELTLTVWFTWDQVIWNAGKLWSWWIYPCPWKNRSCHLISWEVLYNLHREKMYWKYLICSDNLWTSEHIEMQRCPSFDMHLSVL